MLFLMGETFYLKLGMRPVCTPTIFISNQTTMITSIEHTSKNKLKAKIIGKEDPKLSVFANDIINYIENPKEFQKMLELIRAY